MILAHADPTNRNSMSVLENCGANVIPGVTESCTGAPVYNTGINQEPVEQYQDASLYTVFAGQFDSYCLAFLSVEQRVYLFFIFPTGSITYLMRGSRVQDRFLSVHI